MPELRIKFDTHGLGDCVQFAHLLQLYKRRGYEVTVQAEENKLFVWQVAGVNIVQGGDLPHHDWGYPWEFEDLSFPDWRGNKTAHGLSHPTLPPIGEKRELWNELCQIRLAAKEFISDKAREEARQFLDGMPHPIFCLHSRGTNWQGRKSLPIETDFRLILELLDRTSGSVVVLDYDRRAPMVGDARCKGIKPSWGHIDVDRLCALYELADVMIGVDSGPFHAAVFTDIKALGVFREIHPVRCCLPNPNATYFVSSRFHKYWESRSHVWNFAEYPGNEPTAEQIADMAILKLSGTARVEDIEPSLLASVPGRFLYRRVGHDERPMELREGGDIGEGAADCEQKWFLRKLDGETVLSIDGDHGAICHLRVNGDGIWRGRWVQFEQMRVELIPLNGSHDVVPQTPHQER